MQDLQIIIFLGETLARRTFDESGDYTVRPFQFDVRESVTQSSAKSNIHWCVFFWCNN